MNTTIYTVSSNKILDAYEMPLNVEVKGRLSAGVVTIENLARQPNQVAVVQIAFSCNGNTSNAGEHIEVLRSGVANDDLRFSMVNNSYDDATACEVVSTTQLHCNFDFNYGPEERNVWGLHPHAKHHCTVEASPSSRPRRSTRRSSPIRRFSHLGIPSARRSWE